MKFIELKKRLFLCFLFMGGLVYSGFSNGITNNTVEAERLRAEQLERKCHGGEIKTCEYAGWSYENGVGFKQDYFQAFTLYKKACDGDYGDSCLSLGLMYWKGRGVSQDVEKALFFTKKACDLKVMDACFLYEDIKNQK
jgi:TPR repeat protein